MTAPEKIFVLPAYNDGKSSAPMTVCGPDFAHSATQYVRADLAQAAIAAAMMVAVKPLEWVEIESYPGGYTWQARKPFGSSYYIHKNKAGLFCWIAGEGDYGSLEAAKAAAQADYQARILSALSIPEDTMAALDAVKAQVRDEALDESSLAVANMEIGFYDGVSGDWHPLTGPAFLSAACAAIRAMKGGE